METNTMQKPKYLGLLNAISNGESAAGVYLEAWADVTPNADLACTLRLVAARERSHGDVFCRRIACDKFVRQRFACMHAGDLSDEMYCRPVDHRARHGRRARAAHPGEARTPLTLAGRRLGERARPAGPALTPPDPGAGGRPAALRA